MAKQWKGFISGIFVSTLVFSLGITTLAVSGKLSLEVDPVNIQVNGATFQPKDSKGQDVLVFAHNGTTYAPLRALADAYGLKVGYDAEKNMATVSTDTGSDASSEESKKPVGEYVIEKNKLLYYAEQPPVPAVDNLLEGSYADITLAAYNRYPADPNTNFKNELSVYEYRAGTGIVAKQLAADYISLLKKAGFERAMVDYRLLSTDKSYEINIVIDRNILILNITKYTNPETGTPEPPEDDYGDKMERYNAYKAIIDEKLRVIKKSGTPYYGSESQYQKEVNTFIQEISRLQSQADELLPDNSHEAQAQRKKLLEKLSAKQAQLTELQYSYSLTLQINALEDQLQAFYDSLFE